MFAFAVYDPRQPAELFLARDRMGQKPLYYAFSPSIAFAFASEPSALLHLPWIDTAVNPQSLTDYFTWGYTPRSTIYQAIHKLPPAAWMAVTPACLDSHLYFDPNDPPPPEGKPLSLQRTITRTRQLVIQAVRRQLVSDVPLGCFLSGGIDSSIIVAAMRASLPDPQSLLTFSIGFDDPRYDETPYAAAVARFLRTQHRHFTVRPNAADDLPNLAAVFAEPFADSSALPTHYLSRETRRHVKVALSGDGGDELFAGYDRYRALALTHRLRALPSPLLKLARAFHRFRGSHPKSLLTRLSRLLATIDLPPGQRYASYLRLFDHPTLIQLLAPLCPNALDLADSSLTLLTEHYEVLFGPPLGTCHWSRDLVQAALALDRRFYLPEDLLTKLDRCSMLHALEVRSPFMDHDLVHFAAALPTAQLLPGGGKRLLRQAFADDLPPSVFKRPKMGFAVPIGDWFRTTLRSMLHDALTASNSFASAHLAMPVVHRLIREHEQRRLDHSHRLYALLMLELWFRSTRP
jgi:asparagine synthase (glutamine-hydrolysing)